MVGLTLSQAAKAANKSKSTLSRAIKTGRLSATRLENGNFLIDPAELYRAYPAPLHNTPHEHNATPIPSEFQRHISMLEQLLEKERETAEREREISAREREVSADLKEDRDRWRQQATSLLADQRPAEPTPPAKRRRWWPF